MKLPPLYPRRSAAATCLICCVLLIISVVLCIGIGPVRIGFGEVRRVMLHSLFHFGNISDIPGNLQKIVWHLRAPRVFLGAMAGMSLSLSGVAMQAFTKNPLADPYVLGISSGASSGAVLVMALGSVFLPDSVYMVQLGAFIGAMIAISLVCFMSRSGGGTAPPVKLVLTGIAVSAMFRAITNFIIYNTPNDSRVREATFWMLGGVAGVKWEALAPIAVVLVPCAAVMFLLSSSLNAMMMGDHDAITLGVDIHRIRKILIVVSALLTGTAVSLSGCIGFVGLVIPHAVRSAVGADHRKVIPVAALSGATFLVWADIGARMLDAPREIPVGVLTAMIGAPFFLYMIRTKRYSFGEKA